MQIVNQIDDYRLRFSIRSEIPEPDKMYGITQPAFRAEPTHYIDVTYESTFDKFERTIAIRGNQIQVSGTNHISSGFGEAHPPPGW